MSVAASGASTGIGRLVGRRRRPTDRRRTNLGLVALFVAPSLIVYLLFMVIPFLGTVQLSLTSWNGFNPTKEFIGLANYTYILSGAAEFWNALRNNLVWAVIGTLAPIVIGLPLAIILWGDTRGRLAFRAIYFIPHILPAVVLGIIWGWIYNPIFGVLNEGLDAVGLTEISRGWLGDKDWALIAVLAAAVWATFGFMVVMFLAGLQGIDMNLVDAARVDGANAWQRMRHVLLPGIAPIFTFVTTITLVGAFSVFDIIFVLTSGGPGTATETLAMLAYKSAFGRNQVGYGSALSLVIAVISLVLAVLFLKLRERQRV